MSDSLTSWLKAHCPVSGLPAGLLAKAAEAEQAGEDYHLTIGAPATPTKQAVLLHRHAGEYFSFLLSPRQAEFYNALGPVLRFAPGEVRDMPSEPRAVTLESVAFVQTDSVDLSQPIRGTCICRFEETPPPAEICLRLESELRLDAEPEATREVGYYCYPQCSPDGQVQFEFAPPKLDGFARGQFAAAFLTVCSPADSRFGIRSQPQSNASGVLVWVS